MRARKLVVALSTALVVVAGCSGGQPELPDRADPAVKAEEARIAAVLGADASIVGEPSACRVRLLGQQAGASFVWATCEAVDPPHTAISAPLRVEGSRVSVPGDGAEFSRTVREMFPQALADFVLSNQDSPEVLP